eukprot:gene2114-31810_t
MSVNESASRTTVFEPRASPRRPTSRSLARGRNLSAAEDLSTKHSMVQVHLPSMPEMIRRQVIEHEGALGWQMGCKLLAENIRAAATVAIVSVPLSISLALASQASPLMGIITAIYGGFFGAALGGSPYNVQGPTGALSALLAMYSVSLGMKVLPWLAIGAGLLSLLANFFGVDRFCNMINRVVMEGFTLGVAFTISANQLPYGLGLVNLKKHVFLSKNLYETFSHVGDAEPLQTGITFIGMGMWFGYMVDMEKGALGGKVKRLETTLDDTYTLELMKDRFPWLEKNPDFFDLPDWEVAAKAGPSVLLSGSISVMLVAVLESLISGKIAAQKTSTEFDSQAEVFSVGGANLVCGLAGGFPCTAALARTNLNITKGATSRISAILSSIGVFIIGKACMPAFSYLPLSFVSAMMLRVTFGMPTWGYLGELWEHDKQSLLVVFIVGFISVAVDPSAGIVLGVAIEQLRPGADLHDYSSRRQSDNDA